MLIRAATSVDIVHLYELWYDTIALQAQNNPHIKLMANSRQLWIERVKQWIHSDDVLLLVGVTDGIIKGFVVAHIMDNDPGLDPPNYALINMLILDLHMVSPRNNMVGELFNELVSLMKEKSITQIQIQVRRGSIIEDGFWRGLGAKLGDSVFWMDV